MAELITVHIGTGDNSVARWCLRAEDIIDLIELSCGSITMVQTGQRGYCAIASIEQILGAMDAPQEHVEVLPSPEHRDRALRDLHEANQQAALRPNPMEQLARAVRGEKESEH